MGLVESVLVVVGFFVVIVELAVVACIWGAEVKEAG